MAALFFLSGRCVNADPVGDFFKKVGQSVSKAFQPQPHAQSNQEEDDNACLAAADFAAIKSCWGVPDSSRTANRPR